MLVTTVNGVGPDGLPFEANEPLPARYDNHQDWVHHLIETGGAQDQPEPARPQRGAPATELVEGRATIERHQGASN